MTRPIRELKGFARVHLEMGERCRVTFQLAADRLAFPGPSRRWIVEPGAVTLYVGASSADTRLEQRIELVGEVREVGEDRVLTTPVTVERLI
jgi:hypothetical protein